MSTLNKKEVERRLNVIEGTGIQTYLGLPAYSLRQKRIQFGYIKNRAQKKLMGWNHREISAGGKEVLIKAVIQAIPTYAMQCFRLPDSICEDIQKLCAGFWWGDKEEKKKLHWKQWDYLCRPKEAGGMGFRNLKSFNRALLAKQVWRMMCNPTSLVARVFQAKYFKNGNILEGEVKQNAFYIWRSLAWSRDLLGRGRLWCVGNGERICVFKDQWVEELHDCKPKERVLGLGENMKVANLICEGGRWDKGKLENLFRAHEVEAICRTPILEYGEEDMLRWRYESKGCFSVKTAYLLETGFYNKEENVSVRDRKFWSRMVWLLSIPPKARGVYVESFFKSDSDSGEPTNPSCADGWDLRPM